LGDPQVGATWAQRPLIFERRDRRFEPAKCAEPWCAERFHGRATAFGDIDGDRDVDVLMTTLNGPVLVLRNDAPPSHALVVRLEGPPPNRRAMGSLVEIETAAGIQRRWLNGGGSFQSADATAAFFGLGEVGGPKSLALRVRWPDASTSEFREVPIDKLLVVTGTASASGSGYGRRPSRGVAGLEVIGEEVSLLLHAEGLEADEPAYRVWEAAAGIGDVPPAEPALASQ
jgi:ASPIC and UnbV